MYCKLNVLIHQGLCELGVAPEAFGKWQGESLTGADVPGDIFDIFI